MNNKLTFIQKKVTELLDIDPNNTSPKGWIIGGKCPYCGSGEKFGIKFNNSTEYKNKVSFNCFRGSCQQKGSEFKLLTHLGKEHLLNHGEFIKNSDKIEVKAINQSSELNLEVRNAILPLGFRRIFCNQYLQDRGFESWQFRLYRIGKTHMVKRLRNYVLFSIVEQGNHKGYVARLELNSHQHKQLEIKLDRHIPKYVNEGGVEFGKLLAGLDEVDAEVNQIILVEGLTDKANVDKLLYHLKMHKVIKCLCTFGKKISNEQIAKLASKGVGKVILMYDPDAIEQSKTYSYLLRLWDIEVKVGYLSDKDPGDLCESELTQILYNVQSPDQFSIDKVGKKAIL